MGIYSRGQKSLKKTKKTVTAKKPMKMQLATKSYVDRKIHANIEDKCIRVSASNNIVCGSVFNTGLQTVSMIPYNAWVQNSGQGDRIGNSIKTRRLQFNFVLRPAPYNVTSNAVPVPQDVIIFFGKVKNSRPLQPISTDFSKMFQNGDSVQGFQSNTQDLIQDVNANWFTVYKTLRYKVAPSSINGLGVNTNYQYYNNNDYKFNIIKRMNLTKYCPKTIKFNDTISQPTNDGLWMWATCVNADGSGASSTIPLYMDYTVTLYYEDA